MKKYCMSYEISIFNPKQIWQKALTRSITLNWSVQKQLTALQILKATTSTAITTRNSRRIFKYGEFQEIYLIDTTTSTK